MVQVCEVIPEDCQSLMSLNQLIVEIIYAVVDTTSSVSSSRLGHSYLHSI